MKKPKASLSAKVRMISKLRERRELRQALQSIYATEEGKVFFRYFLKHCNITNPVIERDPYKIVANEAVRRLGMSYLSLMGRDDPDHLLETLQAELDANQR
jgi:hypothetical protein